MAQQQYQLAEFIEKVKREKYRKNDPYFFDDSTPITSNRGNKLNRNARLVHHGRLNGQIQFQETIEHAGYRRKVISLNPPFYTPEGDIVEDESDIDEDDEQLEENIYKDIKLEDILAPLSSAANLPTHPTLSRPYKERGLEEMIKNAEEALHREQDILFSVKAIYTGFRGDASWLPLGTFQDETSNRLLERVSYTTATPALNGRKPSPVATIASIDDATDMTMHQSHLATGNKPGSDQDADMTGNAEEEVKQITNETTNSSSTNVPEAVMRTDYAASNLGSNGQPTDAIRTTEDNPVQTLSHMVQIDSNTIMDRETVLEIEQTADGSVESMATDDAESVAPSHRRTTRRQANPSTRNTPSPVNSFSAASYAPLTDPFFAFPQTALPGHTMGLPQQMADETGLALSTYIPKQEEIVRSLRELHSGLLRALRMRQEVWKWTRAEGHVGEMSDEEDWPDLELWDIDPRDARIKWTKGQHEDEQADEEEEKRAKRVRRAGRAKD